MGSKFDIYSIQNLLRAVEDNIQEFLIRDGVEHKRLTYCVVDFIHWGITSEE